MRFSCFVVVAASCFVLSGCPEDGGAGDGAGEGEAEGEGEGGTVIDVGCDADDACVDGLVCDLASGDCKAGLDCSVNPGVCTFCGSPGTNCGFGDAPAFCDVDGGNVCRRVKGACAPCADDAECGEGPTGLPSVCNDGFCAPGCGACPAGFTCSGGGCVPVESAGSCDGAVSCSDDAQCPDGLRCSELGVCLDLCATDVDCPVGHFCGEGPGPQDSVCVRGCELGQRVEQDGAPKICHGDGRFGDPCTEPGTTNGCPNGTECRGDGACDRAGCQSDIECPLPRTYCDVENAACVDGCQDESDCAAFELCVDNQCEAQGCRSKETSCEIGQFCCGEELFSDDTTCPAPAVDGECFQAQDPFCRTCESDDDCADINAFGFTSYCYELTRQNEQGEDESLGKFCSVGCRDNDDCPRGIGCKLSLPTSEDGVTTQGCIDAPCAGF